MMKRLGIQVFSVSATSMHAWSLGDGQHLQGHVVAGKGHIPAPLLPQVAQVSGRCQPDVMKCWPAQDPYCVWPHHVLPGKYLQQCCLPCALGNQTVKRSPALFTPVQNRSNDELSFRGRYQTTCSALKWVQSQAYIPTKHLSGCPARGTTMEVST